MYAQPRKVMEPIFWSQDPRGGEHKHRWRTSSNKSHSKRSTSRSQMFWSSNKQSTYELWRNVSHSWKMEVSKTGVRLMPLKTRSRKEILGCQMTAQGTSSTTNMSCPTYLTVATQNSKFDPWTLFLNLTDQNSSVRTWPQTLLINWHFCLRPISCGFASLK